jgi:hypothetical protein
MRHPQLPRALAGAALALAGALASCGGPRAPALGDSLPWPPAGRARGDATRPFPLRRAPPDAATGFTLRYATADTSVRYTLRRARPCGSAPAPSGGRRTMYCEETATAGRPSLADVMRTLPGSSRR